MPLLLPGRPPGGPCGASETREGRKVKILLSCKREPRFGGSRTPRNPPLGIPWWHFRVLLSRGSFLENRVLMHARASLLHSEGIPGASDEQASTHLSNHLLILVILAKSCSRVSESFVFEGPGSPRDLPRSPFWHPWVTFPEHWGVPGPPRRPGGLSGGTLGRFGLSRDSFWGRF